MFDVGSYNSQEDRVSFSFQCELNHVPFGLKKHHNIEMVIERDFFSACKGAAELAFLQENSTSF